MDKYFCSFGCESATDGPKLTELVEAPTGKTSDVCSSLSMSTPKHVTGVDTGILTPLMSISFRLIFLSCCLFPSKIKSVLSALSFSRFEPVGSVHQDLYLSTRDK